MLSIKENVVEYESTLGTYQSEGISPMLEVDGKSTSLNILHSETISSPDNIQYYIPKAPWQFQLNFDIKTKNPNFSLKFPLTVKQVKKFRQNQPRSIQRSAKYMKAAETALTKCKDADMGGTKYCARIAKVPENCKYCKSTGLTISKFLLKFKLMTKPRNGLCARYVLAELEPSSS